MPTDDTISELRARIDELESKLDAFQDGGTSHGQPFGRRRLLAAAGGAIAGGVLASGAAPAAAANGDPLILGSGGNSATNPTGVTGNGFKIERTVYDQVSTAQPAFDIWAFDAPDSLDIPALRVNSQSLLWAGGKRAVWAVAFNGTGDGDGSYIANTEGNGLRVAVSGQSQAPQPGHVSVVIADAQQAAPEAVGFHATTGGRAHLLLEPRAAAGAPTTLLHDKGEVALDANTALHVCHTAGTPGSWHRLLSDRSPLGTAAGTVVLRDSPFRLYDSRPGRESALSGPKGVIAAGEARDLDVVGQGTPAVPAGAIGVLATVTVTATGASGHLRAHATGTPPPNTSIINWDHTGQTIATTTTIRIGDDGAITIRASSTATHLIVDILGWIA
jgi:hypothetical protein